MTAPERIPIRHEPNYRTETIGWSDDGQFLASLSYAYREEYDQPPGDDWADHKYLTGALHRFDHDGRHVHSDLWIAGTWAEQMRADGSDSPLARAEVRMAALLDDLPGRTFGDIAIRPFRVVMDGIVFALDVHEPDGLAHRPTATLWPDDLLFAPPWDGCYDT